jgi:rRNA biogenesis protein RRP5
MPGQKRSLQDTAVPHKSKKPKLSDEVKTGKKAHESVSAAEVDFPRGGGTSFTPLEVKTIRAEAIKEANEELFDVSLFI